MKKNKPLFLILILITANFTTCKPPNIISFSSVITEHQWRKTEVAIYNAAAEIETYTFIFSDAENCEKNSFLTFGGLYNNWGNMYEYNTCEDLWLSYKWNIDNDSLYLTPYDFDTILSSSSKFIEHYDERSYTLRYDTLIEGKNKRIKETYNAF